MKNCTFTYPGFVKKCITFTIDDGNVRLDKKFMDYVKPAGILGTFNLCTPLWRLSTKEEYREFYQGYDIANHCRYHAFPFSEIYPKKNIVDEIFVKETANKDYIYKTEEEGIYRNFTYNWTYIVEDKQYMECVDSCQKDLEDIFGKGNVRGYIWPCGEQPNENVFNALKAYGFQSIRKTGNLKDSTNFSLPKDRTRWTINANYTCMTEVAKLYDEYPDDGNLKFFCFGLHSHDFENNNKWDVLEDFCNKYGNRPQDFWYTTVATIFDYEDAVGQVKITGNSISNPSKMDIYMIVDGKKVVIPAGQTENL